MAVSIFDLDVDESKKTQLEKAKEDARKKNIIIVSSNPCFEVWYLEHFGYTTKPYVSSDEVVRDLEKEFLGIVRTHVILNYCILRQKRQLRIVRSLICIMQKTMCLANLQTLEPICISWFKQF